jgi:LmbE family N-acetylglucosaminyl deacetylase
MPSPDAPLFVVSPHLDDAVFSCGMLLASHPGSVVCTVFCGVPAPPQRTPWDESAGHRDSSEALRARIAEDEQALSLLRARAVRLSFLDSQYGATPTITELTRALAHAWRTGGCGRLVAPLGLYHSDHVLVGEACRLLVCQARMQHAILYEDALYRTIAGAARRQYETLRRKGYAFSALDEHPQAAIGPVRAPGSANVKWRAVHAYRSQLRALADAHPSDLVEPERYVVIDRVPSSRYRYRHP